MQALYDFLNSKDRPGYRTTLLRDKVKVIEREEQLISKATAEKAKALTSEEHLKALFDSCYEDSKRRLDREWNERVQRRHLLVNMKQSAGPSDAKSALSVEHPSPSPAHQSVSPAALSFKSCRSVTPSADPEPSALAIGEYHSEFQLDRRESQHQLAPSASLVMSCASPIEHAVTVLDRSMDDAPLAAMAGIRSFGSPITNIAPQPSSTKRQANSALAGGSHFHDISVGPLFASPEPLAQY